jgi:hypothetical protein
MAFDRCGLIFKRVNLLYVTNLTLAYPYAMQGDYGIIVI